MILTGIVSQTVTESKDSHLEYIENDYVLKIRSVSARRGK